MLSCTEFSTTAVVCRTVGLVLASGISGRPSSEPGLCEDPGLEPPESEFSLNNHISYNKATIQALKPPGPPLTAIFIYVLNP